MQPGKLPVFTHILSHTVFDAFLPLTYLFYLSHIHTKSIRHHHSVQIPPHVLVGLPLLSLGLDTGGYRVRVWSSSRGAGRKKTASMAALHVHL